MSDKLLEVKNLSVEYDTEISTVYAVNGLDLDLNYGETCLLYTSPSPRDTR